MAKYEKGHPGGPGRPPRSPQDRINRPPTIIYDIKQAARSYCEESLERLVHFMRGDDERVALAAAIAIIERGYGKPEQKAEATVTHKFAVVPEVMEKAEWLARKGQPAPMLDLKVTKHALDPDRGPNGSSH